MSWSLSQRAMAVCCDNGMSRRPMHLHVAGLRLTVRLISEGCGVTVGTTLRTYAV